MGTDIHGVFQAKIDNKWETVETEFEFNRHYQLFAILADVRNGYGFAGIPTGDAVVPISEPKGLPKEKRIMEMEEMCDFGDHSFSWLSDKEMLDWYNGPEITVGRCGIISRKAYIAWDGKTPPDDYCYSRSGPGIRVINDSAVEKEMFPDYTDVHIEWVENLKEGVKYFFDEVKRLKETHGEIRFVFGFDS
jgi:hypothetical protein